MPGIIRIEGQPVKHIRCLSRSTPAWHPLEQPMTVEKTKTKLARRMGEAIADFRMIEDGDRVMVCLSGGKDSYTLLELLLDVQKRAPVRFDLLAVNLDQKQPGFPADVLPGYLSDGPVRSGMVGGDTYSVVKRLVPEGRPSARSVRVCGAAFSTT